MPGDELINTIHARIITPNDISYLPVIQNFIRQTSDMAGIPYEDATRLALAVEEAFTNVLRYGFESGVKDEVTVGVEAGAGEAQVTIGYTGLPFDPEQIPNHWPDPEQEPLQKGLGMGLMRVMCDAVYLRNLGHGHLETVLHKRYAEPHLGDPAAKPADKEMAANGGTQPYQIRPMQQEEAVQVSRLAFIAYGDSYPFDSIYFPDRVRGLNAEGKLRSWVAVTGSGEVIAHSALARTPATSNLAELGIAFTKPGQRGRGCMNNLWKALKEYGQNMGLDALFTMAVTSHPFTQKAMRKHDIRECALLVAEVPALRFRSINEAKDHRETIMLMFHLLKEPQQLLIHPPQAHAGVVARIFHQLGLSPQVGSEGKSHLPVQGQSVIQVELNHDFNTAKITVSQYGPDFMNSIRAQLMSLRGKNIFPLYLYLPLSDPATAAATPQMEKLGFFFAGVAPAVADGFYLLLQHLGGMVYDYSKVQTATDEGRELLQYVKTADPAQ